MKSLESATQVNRQWRKDNTTCYYSARMRFGWLPAAAALLCIFCTQKTSFAFEPIDTWDQYLSHIQGPKKVKWAIAFDGVNPYRSESADELMVPASTVKVITAIAALKYLGRDFRFKNTFRATFDSNSATLSNAELLMSSDPTWAHPYYQEDFYTRINLVISELKRQGVKKVVGGLKITSTSPYVSDYVRPGPQGWKREWYTGCMAAIPSEINIYGNCGDLEIVNRHRAVWVTEGVSTPVTIDLNDTHQEAIATPVLDDHKRVISWKITGGFPPIGDRHLYLPQHYNRDWLKYFFVTALKRANIEYTDAVESVWPGKRITVDLSSVPLHQLIYMFLERSINLVGDRLFLEIAHAQNTAHYSDTENNLVKALVGNDANLNGVKINDGSGLRIDNRVRATVLKSLLDRVKEEPYFKDFLNALAISGQVGTLSTKAHPLLGKSPYTEGKIYAKTGTEYGIKNLVGYFLKPDGALESFAILTQNILTVGSAQPPLIEAQTVPVMDRLLVEFARQNSGSPGFKAQ